MRTDVPDASILFPKARTELRRLQRPMLALRVVNERHVNAALEGGRTAARARFTFKLPVREMAAQLQFLQ